MSEVVLCVEVLALEEDESERTRGLSWVIAGWGWEGISRRGSCGGTLSPPDRETVRVGGWIMGLDTGRDNGGEIRGR